MKLELVAYISMVMLIGGCRGRDRVPYHKYFFYRDAAIVARPIQGEEHVTLLSVTEGDGIVLLIWDGFYRGRYTTAHSSHEGFFMQIPPGTRAGDVVHCSSEDGSLAYDAFAGYGFKYLDAASPAHAKVEVLDVSESRLRAKVDLHAKVLHGPARPQWVDLRKQYDFNLQPLPGDHTEPAEAEPR